MGNRTDDELMEKDLMMMHNSNCAYESSKKLMLDTEEGLTSEDPFPKQAWLDSSAIESGKAAFQEESIGLSGVHCSRCGSFVKASDSPLLKGVAPVLLYTHCGKEAHRRLCAPCVLETYECPFCPTQDDGE